MILAAATGARRSELVALRWSDIDIDLARVTIRHGIVLGPNGWSRRTPRPTRYETFQLIRQLVAAIVAYRIRADELAVADLRYYATQLLSGGVDVRTVAGRLGHRNPSTTLTVYSHFLPEALRSAAALLGRLFDVNSGPEESKMEDSPAPSSR